MCRARKVIHMVVIKRKGERAKVRNCKVYHDTTWHETLVLFQLIAAICYKGFHSAPLMVYIQAFVWALSALSAPGGFKKEERNAALFSEH
jgi:hypothetical protein